MIGRTHRRTSMPPRVVATLHFSSERPPRAAEPPAGTTVRPETVELLVQMFALETRLAGAGDLIAAVYRDDGTWHSHVAGVADLLNRYFGPAARYVAFPTLPVEPPDLIVHSVADLFGARVTWARAADDDAPTSM